MRAIFFNGKEPTLREDYPKPSLRQGETIIRVSLAGICGTDLEILQGYESFHGVLGHEFVGIIEESIQENMIGKRVVGEINCACHNCDFCATGLTRHCRNRTVLGISGRDGAFAQHLSLPNENLHVITSGLSEESAVFVEPTAAAFEILEQIHLEPNYEVAVLGDGRLGAIVSQVMRNVGSAVTCIGKHQRKISLISSLGINALRLEEINGSQRFDVVVDCTGSADGLHTAAKLVKPRGTIVMKTTTQKKSSVDLSRIVVDEVRIIGSRCGPFNPTIHALESGAVRTRELIDWVFPLSRALEAFKKASENEVLKVLLRCSE